MVQNSLMFHFKHERELLGVWYAEGDVTLCVNCVYNPFEGYALFDAGSDACRNCGKGL